MTENPRLPHSMVDSLDVLQPSLPKCLSVYVLDGTGPPPGVPDCLFRCAYCIKVIGEDLPVYMRHDHCYCSQNCRDKGLSRLYANLAEMQLEECSRRGSGSLAASGNARSDSSLASCSTSRRLEERPVRGGRLEMLARIGQRVIGTVLQRVASQWWGAQMLRTYSSGVLWGREFSTNSSAALLFQYLPEVDEHLTRIGASGGSDQSPSSSEVAGSFAAVR